VIWADFFDSVVWADFFDGILWADFFDSVIWADSAIWTDMPTDSTVVGDVNLIRSDAFGLVHSFIEGIYWADCKLNQKRGRLPSLAQRSVESRQSSEFHE